MTYGDHAENKKVKATLLYGISEITSALAEEIEVEKETNNNEEAIKRMSDLKERFEKLKANISADVNLEHMDKHCQRFHILWEVAHLLWI